MADGRDNVSVQPVPISIGPKIKDRTYEVDAHTTETQTRSISTS
jgi:hypothetical protein